MRYMLLMRHANAAFPDPGTTDYDRPLTDIGRAEARSTAAMLADAGLLPDRVVCSTARRAAQTLEVVSSVLPIDAANVVELPTLYSGGPEVYADAVRRAAEDEVTLLIGHNPMIEDCALDLLDDGNEDDVNRLRSGFPTGAIAVLRLTGVNGSTAAYLERLLTTH